MSKIILFSKKFLMILMIVNLGLMVLPTTATSAAGLEDDPAPESGEREYLRLERAFRRLQRQFERQDKMLERSDNLLEKAQNLIDKATEKGLDASALQTALDNLIAALPAVQDAHDEASAIIATHDGFDANGNVSDPDAARDMIGKLRTALQTTREALDGTAKVLLQSIRDFFRENREVFQSEKERRPEK